MLNITITEQTPNNMLRAIRAACNELLGDTTADLTAQAAQHNSLAEELRVACERELDKSAACLTAHTAERQTAASPATAEPYGQGGLVDAGQFYRVGEQVSEQTALGPLVYGGSVTGTGTIETPPQNIPKLEPTPAVEMDSTGAEWNSELHASTKAKNQDGTWKKRRGAGKADEPTPVQLPEGYGQVSHVPVAIEDATPAQVAAALPPLPPTPPAPAAPLVTMNDIYALITNGKAVLNDVIAAAQAMGFADVGAFSRDATPEQRAQLLAQLTKGVA